MVSAKLMLVLGRLDVSSIVLRELSLSHLNTVGSPSTFNERGMVVTDSLFIIYRPIIFNYFYLFGGKFIEIID